MSALPHVSTYKGCIGEDITEVQFVWRYYSRSFEQTDIDGNMEFPYSSKTTHNGVEFYLNDTRTQACLIYGGCIICISRPQSDESVPHSGTMVKFGLCLGRKEPQHRIAMEEHFIDQTVTGGLDSYVKTELRRKGMYRRGLVSSETDSPIFVDALDLMNRDANCSVQELCGLKEILVRDPDVAEQLIALCVSSGIVLKTIEDRYRDGQGERSLQLLDPPSICNAYSGYPYVASPGVMELVQTSMINPPAALVALVDGLFDGVPCGRCTIKDDKDVPARMDVVIVGNSAVKSISSSFVRHMDDAATTKKTARICPCVQVKYIPPVVNIWDHVDSTDEIRRSTGRRGLASIWATFCRITYALDLNTDPSCDIPYELQEAKAKLSDACEAVFGRRTPSFLPPWYRKDCTTAQKFLALQYVLCLQGMPNCYYYMERLCEVYETDIDETDLSIDRDGIGDLLMETFRYGAFLGAAVETVASADHRSSEFLETPVDPCPDCVACMDADLLLDIATETLENTSVNEERDLRLAKLAHILEAVYSGTNLVVYAAKYSRCLGGAELLCHAIDITTSSLFDGCERLSRLCMYITAVIDSRLKEAKVPSFFL
nr:tegument protein UL21 [Psittacid alphaherpesvirus 6]